MGVPAPGGRRGPIIVLRAVSAGWILTTIAHGYFLRPFLYRTTGLFWRHEILARQLRYYHPDPAVSVVTRTRPLSGGRWLVACTPPHFSTHISFHVGVPC